jgi:hypothetical protein
MTSVIPIEEVRNSAAVAVFDGHDDAPVAFYSLAV